MGWRSVCVCARVCVCVCVHECVCFSNCKDVINSIRDLAAQTAAKRQKGITQTGETTHTHKGLAGVQPALTHAFSSIWFFKGPATLN